MIIIIEKFSIYFLYFIQIDFSYEKEVPLMICSVL